MKYERMYTLAPTDIAHGLTNATCGAVMREPGPNAANLSAAGSPDRISAVDSSHGRTLRYARCALRRSLRCNVPRSITTASRCALFAWRRWYWARVELGPSATSA